MSTICRRPATGPPVKENSFTTLFTGIFAAVATPATTGHPGTTGPVNGQIGRPSIAAIPLVTVFGLELASTLAFAVVTETIFSWPGVGKLIIDSISTLDRPVMVSYLVLVAFLFITINLIVDLSYALLDPRIRRGRG